VGLSSRRDDRRGLESFGKYIRWTHHVTSSHLHHARAPPIASSTNKPTADSSITIHLHSMPKSKSKQAEALQLLDDLDSFTPIEAPAADSNSGSPIPHSSTPSNRRQDLSPNVANTGSNQGETAEALAILDEIQQRATEPAGRLSHSISRSGTPTLRKSTERVKLGGGASTSLLSGTSTSSLHKQASSSAVGDSAAKKAAESTGGGGWGWGSVWSSASAAIQQARTVVDEQVKYLPQVNNEQAKKWREGVIEYAKTAQLDKIGTTAACTPSLY
jgi:hypothetical protein